MSGSSAIARAMRGALVHAAADLGGIEVLEAREADQRQLERGDLRISAGVETV